MTPSLSKHSQAGRAAKRRGAGSSGPHQAAARRRAAGHEGRLLGRYVDWRGDPRELHACPGAGGSVLVVDRDATTKGDRRLVAHLAADEPVDNAAIVSLRYIDDVRDRRVVCRALTPRDARTVPLAEEEQVQLSAATLLADREPSDQRGYRYRLDRVQTGMSIPELRWQRHGTPAPACNAIVSVREAVAALESYEPVRGLSIRALALHDCDPEVSTTVLRAELTRVQNSPIVLNRCLREAVLASTDRQQLSMSEIALRCGRVKRDRRGNESGETSWLARRLGLLPEAGQGIPTPWVHTDVLALIARRGLGLSPREVEVP
ncbi:MAG: hypothetical protein JWL67_1333 [Solirubrobacterales bacterium]|jgi:hypothetical protein|nr:hypothetical protein [Solirubrobacterales bacterium]